MTVFQEKISLNSVDSISSKLLMQLSSRNPVETRRIRFEIVKWPLVQWYVYMILLAVAFMPRMSPQAPLLWHIEPTAPSDNC